MLDVEGDGTKRPDDMHGRWPSDERSVLSDEDRPSRRKCTTSRSPHHGKLIPYIPDASVIVVHHNAEKSRDLALNYFEEQLGGNRQVDNVISSRTVALEDVLTVPTKTPMVLELMLLDRLCVRSLYR